jgi:hypothetical protein
VAAREQPPQRLATPADAPAISALMRASILALFPAFYRAYGFREVERTMVPLPDGVELEGVAMERPCAPS